MKSYLNRYLAYGEEGREFLKKLSKVIEPLIKEELDKGFNPYEVENLINSEVSTFLAEYRLRYALALKKEERNENTSKSK